MLHIQLIQKINSRTYFLPKPLKNSLEHIRMKKESRAEAYIKNGNKGSRGLGVVLREGGYQKREREKTMTEEELYTAIIVEIG